ncbi:MAG: sensor histidine kinase, partial [Fusobacteria bacterium]
SIFLARNIKSQLFGYEPDEIAKFYSERQLIFDTISDEIITLDSTGKITKMNKIAKKNLQKSDEVILKKIHNEIIMSKTMISNREYRLSSGIVYISTLLISNTNDKFNILFIIKSGAKVKQLAKDITGVTQIINSMRATVHEFKNKIHVISGLLRLEEYEEAKKYVSSLKLEVDHENNEVENINDTTIKALLLTKINLAKEKQITLKVEEESNLMSNHKNIDSDDLIVIIGNLIENAIESFSHEKEGEKEIKTYFLEDSNKIYIEVSDNGDPITNIENIFKVGISSKGEGRGSGLALIKNIVSIYNGTINIKVKNNFKTFSIELIKEVL